MLATLTRLSVLLHTLSAMARKLVPQRLVVGLDERVGRHRVERVVQGARHRVDDPGRPCGLAGHRAVAGTGVLRQALEVGDAGRCARGGEVGADADAEDATAVGLEQVAAVDGRVHGVERRARVVGAGHRGAVDVDVLVGRAVGDDDHELLDAGALEARREDRVGAADAGLPVGALDGRRRVGGDRGVEGGGVVGVVVDERLRREHARRERRDAHAGVGVLERRDERGGGRLHVRGRAARGDRLRRVEDEHDVEAARGLEVGVVDPRGGR